MCIIYIYIIANKNKELNKELSFFGVVLVFHLCY